MYQQCYFNLTAWDHTATLILPERCFHFFEFKSEPLKSLTQTLSQWCVLPLCQFDLKCSGQVAFLSLISYRGTQFSHIFLIASLETAPSRVCLFSVLRWAETPAAVSLLLLPAQVITQKALTEHLKWEFRLQLSIRAVALLRVTVAFVRSFVAEQAIGAGAGQQQQQQQSEVDSSGRRHDRQRSGDRASSPYLRNTYQIILQAAHPDFQVIPSKEKKRAIFHIDLNEDEGTSSLMCTDQFACALKDMHIWS